MIKHFRKRLQQGELLVGVGVTLPSPEVSELLAEAGFDWLFLDAEHAPLEYERAAGYGDGGRQPGGVHHPRADPGRSHHQARTGHRGDGRGGAASTHG